MYYLAVITGLFLSSGENSCTYDEADQIAKLQALASKVEGSSLSESTHTVTWLGSKGEKYTVVYGGCDHLGHQITVAGLFAELPSEVELFAIAQRNANALWPGGEAQLLVEALETGNFLRTKSELGTRYEIIGTDYSEMYLESRKENGAVAIELGWVRDF